MDELKSRSMRQPAAELSFDLDLGSPIVEDHGSPPPNPNISPEKSKFGAKNIDHQSSPHFPASPILLKPSSQLKRLHDRQGISSIVKVSSKMETSTPVNPVMRKRAVSALTPVKEQQPQHNISPVLKKRKISDRRDNVKSSKKMSVDMFGSFDDDEDDMFKDMSMPVDPSFLSATQLVSVLNKGKRKIKMSSTE